MQKNKTHTRSVRILCVIKGINLFCKTLTRLNKNKITKTATKQTKKANKKIH